MASPQWCFGDFRLDPATACLWRGAQPLALTPKAFDVLHALVTQADRVVTKDALLDAVWPETAVSDTVVRIAIGELRKALGDTAQGSRYIVTVPRRGYRFVAPVVADTEAVREPRAVVPMPPAIPPLETSGTPLVPEAGPAQPRLLLPEAERRQLTVVFCDLVGSTILSTRLDPEDYREVVRAYHRLCAEVMQRFEGYVAQYLGDGVLGYFGYPVAHEDDAQRAVRAGLALLEALAAQPPHPALPPGEALAVRLAIHTGLVVMGDVGTGSRPEPLALGEVPNIAARLQPLAEPNTLVLSAMTQHLVAGYFRCKALGAYALPGLEQPMEVYRVLGVSGAQSRLEVAATHDLTPLVGRTQEVGLLTACWTRVTEGSGQVVLLGGEAGIGKSRLVQVLKAHVTEAGFAWLECQGSPYHQHTALYPLTELVTRRLLAVASADPTAPPLQRLEALLTQQGLPLAETVPLLAPLLSLPLSAAYAPVSMSSEHQRRQTLHVLLHLVLRLAATQPLLFILEDLHWFDPSTLEWLSLLVEQGPTTRMLVLCTTRPDMTLPWIGRSHCTPVTLTRLSQSQTTELTYQVAQGKALPAEVVAQLVAKTDGVPLFVEEMTRTVLESGVLQEHEAHYALTGPLPSLAIPVTLHDALLARLDRLGMAKRLAQLGATLGREFAYALLQAVAPWDEATLQEGLQQLVAAEVLYPRGLPPQATYVFKHALIQDAAYQSLLKRTRQQYHQHIAERLETQFPETVETQPELLAHHYTEAGLQERAAGYWQRAGERALQRSANPEAVQHLTRGLQVLAGLPETPARGQQELDLLVALGPALLATQGPTPGVEQTYTRARVLCTQLGEISQLYPTLRGLWQFHVMRGALPTARELGEQLCELAQRTSIPTPRLEAHAALGSTLFFLGEYALARSHHEQAIALTDLTAQRALVLRNGVVPGVACLADASLTLWCLGFPAQAVQRSQEALRLAQELAHPSSLAVALHWAANLYHRRRETPAVQAQANALWTLATVQGLPIWEGLSTFWQAWALDLPGQGSERLVQMRQGLEATLATGHMQSRPFCLLLLAEATAHAGQIATGLSLLAEALTTFETIGRGDMRAEAYRLQGELLLRTHPGHLSPDTRQTEAERCFQQALTLARHQHAKSWELRAATSLARLWQRQGQRQAAYGLLAPVYGWFTEGFDTADLQDARALLTALAE